MGYPGIWRLNIVFLVLILAVVGLFGWLATLVAGSQGETAEQALRQQRIVTPWPGRPGNIFARVRRGHVLVASSRQVPSCYADPHLIPEDQINEVAIKISDALDVDAGELQDKFYDRQSARFVWVKRGITDAEAQAVKKLNIPAIGLTYEWRREYPNGRLAGTVLGFRRQDGVAGHGIELSMDRYLAAADGKRVMLADAFRRPIYPMISQTILPTDGHHVFLCMDANIQGELQSAVADAVGKYNAKWGAGVVIRPSTGEVLAMCSSPTYDPNFFSTTPVDYFNNRAINMPYEPGSVAKPLFAALAVENGLMTYETKIFCENGVYHAHKGGRISDHGAAYGLITLCDVNVFSSNIGMAKVGEKMGNERLYEGARLYGFGEETGIELPGESGGILRPLEKWDGYSLRRVPFGQEISVTTLQLAMAYAAIANGGLLMKPILVDYIVDPDGKEVFRSRPQVVRRVLSESVALQTIDVMQQVVDRGTGKACRMKYWTSFGKTGTAQIPGPGGYVPDAYTGSFVGGAPVGKPEVICLISIYWPQKSKGYYGATVAAPYVKRVLERTLSYLDVPPDKSETRTSTRD